MVYQKKWLWKAYLRRTVVERNEVVRAISYITLDNWWFLPLSTSYLQYFNNSAHLWCGSIFREEGRPISEEANEIDWNEYTGPVVVGQRVVYVPEYDMWVESSN